MSRTPQSALVGYYIWNSPSKGDAEFVSGQRQIVDNIIDLSAKFKERGAGNVISVEMSNSISELTEDSDWNPDFTKHATERSATYQYVPVRQSFAEGSDIYVMGYRDNGFKTVVEDLVRRNAGSKIYVVEDCLPTMHQVNAERFNDADIESCKALGVEFIKARDVAGKADTHAVQRRDAAAQLEMGAHI